MATTGYALEQILGYVSLLKQVETIKTGIPKVLPDSYEMSRENVINDDARYVTLHGTRATMHRVEYGAPSMKAPLVDIGDRPVKLAHFFEHIDLKPNVLAKLRNYDNYNVQKLGMQEVGRQIKQAMTKVTNTRRATTYQVLANGKLYFDGLGNLLPTSSGQKTTLDFGMSANNQNQLNGILDTGWQYPTTNIPKQVRKLRRQAAQATGYPLKYAFYGVNVPGYLEANNWVENYLAREPAMRAEFLETGELPKGLFGLTWIPAYEAFYADSAGTNQTIFGDDVVVFAPEAGDDTFDVIQGSYCIPKSLNIIANAEAAMTNVEQVFGDFAYAKLIDDPVTVRIYYGTTYLPVMKNPDAFFEATVNF
jgi:hypothetical protein